MNDPCKRRLQGLFFYKYQSIERDEKMNLHVHAPDKKYMTVQELIDNGEWMDYWKEDAEGAGLNIVATCICKDAPDEAAAQECADLGAALV